MIYEEFKTALLNDLQDRFNGCAAVSQKSVSRNNSISQEVLVLSDSGSNVSPLFYLNDCFCQYQQGRPISSISEEIQSLFRKQQGRDMTDLSFFTDYTKIRDKIVYKLIHYEKNRELLRTVPHVRYLDLAVVFYCSFGGSVNAAVLIHNSHLSFWNITKDTLLKLAKHNTPLLFPFTLQNMADVLDGLWCGRDCGSKKTALPLYVLSNSRKYFGAACLLYEGVLSEFSRELGSDLYILPSSIHEILLLPAHKDDLLSKELTGLVQEVNASHISPEEFLSDHIYFYSRCSDILCM